MDTDEDVPASAAEYLAIRLEGAYREQDGDDTFRPKAPPIEPSRDTPFELFPLGQSREPLNSSRS
jgi:hypothetical protein